MILPSGDRANSRTLYFLWPFKRLLNEKGRKQTLTNPPKMHCIFFFQQWQSNFIKETIPKWKEMNGGEGNEYFARIFADNHNVKAKLIINNKLMGWLMIGTFQQIIFLPNPRLGDYCTVRGQKCIGFFWLMCKFFVFHPEFSFGRIISFWWRKKCDKEKKWSNTIEVVNN